MLQNPVLLHLFTISKHKRPYDMVKENGMICVIYANIIYILLVWCIPVLETNHHVLAVAACVFSLRTTVCSLYSRMCVLLFVWLIQRNSWTNRTAPRMLEQHKQLLHTTSRHSVAKFNADDIFVMSLAHSFVEIAFVVWYSLELWTYVGLVSNDPWYSTHRPQGVN